MIDLGTLMASLFGYRPDFERNNEIILMDCLQSSARLLASRSLCLRSAATFPQPTDGMIQTASLATVATDQKTIFQDMEMLRVFAVRHAGVWLREAPAYDIPNVQIRPAWAAEGSNPNHGVPTLFFPILGGALLDKAKGTGDPERLLDVMFAYNLPRDTMVWPFHPDHEEALVSGALMLLMERPGKGQDMRLSMQRRQMFSSAVGRIKGEMAMGHVGHDWRQHVQTAGVPSPVPVVSNTPSGPPSGPPVEY